MLSIIAELWLFLKVRKKFWLLPVMLVLGVFGIFLSKFKGESEKHFCKPVILVRIVYRLRIHDSL